MSILTEKAVLAALNVGGWDARKLDRNASEVVHQHFHAESDSGNYNKTLFDVKDKSWKAITSARGALRNFHYERTVPWVHKGAQLLPAAMYLAYNSEIIKLIAGYEEACREFIEHHYARLKADAKKKRNGLYREDDYPSEDSLRRKFYAEVVYFPVPDSGHLAVDLSNAEIARIKADTDRMIEQAVRQAQRDVWVRLHEPVSKMAAALADPERSFHDTLVSNIKDIVNIAPSLNLTNDERLAGMIAEVKKSLTKVSPDRLRDDEGLRAEQAKKAKALADKMRMFVRPQ